MIVQDLEVIEEEEEAVDSVEEAEVTIKAGEEEINSEEIEMDFEEEVVEEVVEEASVHKIIEIMIGMIEDLILTLEINLAAHLHLVLEEEAGIIIHQIIHKNSQTKDLVGEIYQVTITKSLLLLQHGAQKFNPNNRTKHLLGVITILSQIKETRVIGDQHLGAEIKIKIGAALVGGRIEIGIQEEIEETFKIDLITALESEEEEVAEDLEEILEVEVVEIVIEEVEVAVVEAEVGIEIEIEIVMIRE